MSKFTVTPLQNGRFFEVGDENPRHNVTLTRLEATELRDELTRALRKTRNPQ